MKTAIKHLAPWLAVAAIGGAIALAPIASADTDPTTPYGTDPMSPAIFGYHTANSPQVDVPFCAVHRSRDRDPRDCPCAETPGPSGS